MYREKTFVCGDKRIVASINQGLLTIVETDGSSFPICLMPLEVWTEINDWIKGH